jgi:lipoprotein-anchoring transpeptidase ErfK/SrfK
MRRQIQEVSMKGLLKVACVALLGFAFMGAGQARADWLDDLFGESGSGGGGGAHKVGFSPKYAAGEIIISFGDRRLYYILRKGEAISYPIAIPKGDARWSGITRISDKRVNPSWTPTAEMRRENPKLPAYVPGGHPRNPLGNRALYLGSSMYRIHGTDAPWLIGQEVSHGCIRMHNEDVADLYARVHMGARVTVTWSRFHES